MANQRDCCFHSGKANVWPVFIRLINATARLSVRIHIEIEAEEEKKVEKETNPGSLFSYGETNPAHEIETVKNKNSLACPLVQRCCHVLITGFW